LIEFTCRNAEKGWNDLRATQLNGLVAAWEFLTRTPTERSEKCDQLKGNLATVTHDGEVRSRWQLELSGGARIWYYIKASRDKKAAGIVCLLDVHTRHPNQTK
jgi:hypothetical protein